MFRRLGTVAGVLAVVAASATACAPTSTNSSLLVDGEVVLVHQLPGTGVRPLVVALHGLGSNAAEMRRVSGLDDFADHNGFDVVYPTAHQVPAAPPSVPSAPGPALRTWESSRRAALVRTANEVAGGAPASQRAWNAGATCCGGSTADDVTYLRHVVAAVAARAPVDLHRVYVLGLSNGGMMALRAVCDAPDLFAAAGSVAGPYLGSSCRRPVWTHLHGGNDPIVPFLGGVPPGMPGWGLPQDWCRCSFPSSATERLRFGTYTAVRYVPAGMHAWPTLSSSWHLDGNAVLWQSLRPFRR